MKKTIKAFLIIFISVCIFGCTGSTTERIIISKDVESYKDVDQLVENADYIVVGKFVKFERNWNMQRDVNNPLEESQVRYHEGHIYQFEISEILKGNIDEKSISVNQGYIERVYLTSDGDLETDLSKVKDSQYVDYLEASYIEPDFNKTYMITMKHDSMFNLYYPSAINAFYEKKDVSLTIPTSEHDVKQSFKTNGKSVIVETEYNIGDEMLDNINFNELKEKIR